MKKNLLILIVCLFLLIFPLSACNQSNLSELNNKIDELQEEIKNLQDDITNLQNENNKNNSSLNWFDNPVDPSWPTAIDMGLYISQRNGQLKGVEGKMLKVTIKIEYISYINTNSRYPYPKIEQAGQDGAGGWHYIVACLDMPYWEFKNVKGSTITVKGYIQEASETYLRIDPAIIV